MVLQIAGVVRGKRIELERETGLPAGSPVVVSIQPKALTLEEKRHLVDVLCGAWADDASLGPIQAEIERQRAGAAPRGADFDARS